MRDVILIVGCEPLIAKGIKFYLEQQGYDTDIVYNESDIFNKVDLKEYKLIILDEIQFKAYQKLIKKYDINIILLIDTVFFLFILNSDVTTLELSGFI